ncbi:nuclear transport factor 2 family protein [Streptomyces sp. NPDC048507]|uniref:nuclear transport factor 2 family protein n=1 Tax=Streptomyces sp. NPDC048507 TaxID=3365560 RepID=UPI0037229BF5
MTVELVGTADRTPRSREFSALYAEVQHFYAQQMRILDGPDAGGWPDTFTEDALFERPPVSAPVRVRAGRTGCVRAGAAREREAGSRLDHWIGMLDVRPQADGSLRTRCSALAYATPGGGGSRVLYVYVMEDVLVPVHGAWRTAHRRVTRDDLA